VNGGGRQQGPTRQTSVAGLIQPSYTESQHYLSAYGGAGRADQDTSLALFQLDARALLDKQQVIFKVHPIVHNSACTQKKLHPPRRGW